MKGKISIQCRLSRSLLREYLAHPAEGKRLAGDGVSEFLVFEFHDVVVYPVADEIAFKVRIIRMRKVPFVDSTGIHNLTNLCLMSQKEGIQVVLSGVNPKVQAVLHKAQFDAMLGEENICSHINIALERAKQLTER